MASPPGTATGAATATAAPPPPSASEEPRWRTRRRLPPKHKKIESDSIGGGVADGRYLFKDWNVLAFGHVVEVTPPAVVVFDGGRRQSLAVDDGVGAQLLDAEHHVAAEADVVRRQRHGRQRASLRRDDEEEQPAPVHRRRFAGNEAARPPGRLRVEECQSALPVNSNRVVIHQRCHTHTHTHTHIYILFIIIIYYYSLLFKSIIIIYYFNLLF